MFSTLRHIAKYLLLVLVILKLSNVVYSAMYCPLEMQHVTCDASHEMGIEYENHECSVDVEESIDLFVNCITFFGRSMDTPPSDVSGSMYHQVLFLEYSTPPPECS